MKRGSTNRSDDTMDDDTDDKDDTKRKSRNLSEKKRRDQFNMLINELSSIVSTNTRKMDKSTVLKSTISFLKNHNENAVRSRAHEIQEDWKPSFLSNEEFTHLILEALDGFIIVFSSSGKIYYASESVTSLLGYLPSDLLNMTIYNLVYEEDQSVLCNMFLNPASVADEGHYNGTKENCVSFTCHVKRDGFEFKDEVTYELVHFIGYFRSDVESMENDGFISSTNQISNYGGEADSRLVFVGTGRLQTPLIIRDMSIVDATKSEFTSRHSLEWKFLFLDHRAPPIIGYLPFEVLGTSGYDYYHVDDLEKVVTCHEELMEKGEGTSCHYRFLTKGQQWIWLQTRFYITYHQWNSKPEFIVCTHRVVSYLDVVKQSKNIVDDPDHSHGSSSSYTDASSKVNSQSRVTSSVWSSKSVGRPSSKSLPSEVNSPSSVRSRVRRNLQSCGGSDTGSVSTDSHGSKQSQLTSHSTVKSATNSHTTNKTIAVATLQQMQGQGQATFLQPQQFMAAIPIQPVLAPGFPGSATVVSAVPASELVQQPMVMATTQSQIQDQLQRKHEELQQLIVQQQEELRRVSEQLFMARYGLLPQLQLSVTMPYTTNAQVVSSTTSSLTSSHGFGSQSSPSSSGLFMGTSSLTVPSIPPSSSSNSVMMEPPQGNTITYSHMPQQANSIMFSPPTSTQQNR